MANDRLSCTTRLTSRRLPLMIFRAVGSNRWGLVSLLVAALLRGQIAPSALAAALPARPAAGSAAVQQYFTLAPADAAAWAQHMVGQRLHTASRLTLAGDDWDEHQVFERALLERIDAGRRLTRRGISHLVSLTEQREAAALARLARQFRLTTYEAFRTDRPEFDRRMKGLKKVVAAWQAAGTRPEDRPQMIAWLESAGDRIGKDRLALLPAIPAFGAAASLARLPSAAKLADAHPPVAAAPREAPAAAARRVAAQPPAIPPAVIRRAASESPPRQQRLETSLPDRAAGADELETHPAFGARSPLAKPAARIDLASAASVPIAAPALPADPPAAKSSGKSASPARRSKPLDGGSIAYLSQANSDVAEVNVGELTARVAGFNRSTTALTNQLQGIANPNVDQLAAAVDQLTELATTRGDLALYCNLLGEHERAEVGVLAPLETAVTMIASQVSRLRESLDDKHDRAAGASLDQLSRRLALLTVTLRSVR